MIPEPQRCAQGTPHALTRMCIAYGLVLAVVTGVVALALAVTRG